MSGSNSGEVTPVSIPNTEVKFSSADGSWGFAPARVGRCQAIFFSIYSDKLSIPLNYKIS